MTTVSSQSDYAIKRRELRGRQNRTKTLAWILGLAGGGLAVFLTLTMGLAQPGDLGTAIGGITGSFWALTGLVIVYLAFLGQQVELSYQQQELEEQRKQLSAQTHQFRRQQDESTFFHMLGRLDGTVHRLRHDNDVGRAVFGPFWRTFREAYNKDTKERGRPESERIRAIADKYLRQYQVHFGPYLQLLYLLLRFLDSSEALRPADRDLYAAIIAGQFSREEASIVAYLVLAPATESQLKQLLEQWGILRCFPDLNFLHGVHKGLFDPKVFVSPGECSTPVDA